MGIVSYRYPGEEWVTIKGDDYIVDKKEGQCYVGYVIWFDVDVKYAHPVYNKATKTWEWTKINQFTDRLKLVSSSKNEKIKDFPRLIHENTQYSSYTPLIKGFQTVEANFETIAGAVENKNEYTPWFYDSTSGSYYVHFFLPGTVRNIEVIPRGTEDPSCATKCIFEVFLDGETVFNRTSSSCPEIKQLKEETCPNDTCEVTCGDIICCYDSNGISVANFPRS